MTKKLWLKFKKRERLPNRKTDIYDVINRETDDWLGRIEWRREWRQYVFASFSALHSRGCLQQIVDFLNELMNERKKE